MFSQIYFHQFCPRFFPTWFMPFAFLSEDKISASCSHDLLWSQVLFHLNLPSEILSTLVQWLTCPFFSSYISKTSTGTFLRDCFLHAFWLPISVNQAFLLGLLLQPLHTLSPANVYYDHSSNDLFHSFFTQLCFLNADWLAFLKNFSLYL